jgi:hypothetical protein
VTIGPKFDGKEIITLVLQVPELSRNCCLPRRAAGHDDKAETRCSNKAEMRAFRMHVSLGGAREAPYVP